MTIRAYRAVWAILLFPVFAQANPGTQDFLEQPLLLGAHRGGALLWPENTVLAFQEAARRWPDILLEADLRLSADGAVVAIHDATVERTTEAQGAVAARSLAELQALDAAYRFTTREGAEFPLRGKGIRIPTLEEVLDAAPHHRFLLEIKDGVEAVAPVLRILRERNAEARVILASFKADVMAHVRAQAPEVKTCYDMQQGMVLIAALRGGDWQAYAPEAEVLSLTEELLTRFQVTREEVARIQEKGIVFQVHTPNTTEELAAALDLGVRSILTDDPERLAQLMDARQAFAAAEETALSPP